jgi:outer membrane protein TolC
MGSATLPIGFCRDGERSPRAIRLCAGRRRAHRRESLRRLLHARRPLLFVVPLVVFLVPLRSFGADTPRTLTLSQCVEAALTKGDELAIIRGTLGVSRAQYEQTVSSNSLALSGSVGYGIDGATGDSGLVTAYASQTGVSVTDSLPQSMQAALTLSGPMTSLSLGGLRVLPLLGSANDSGLVSLSASQKIWDGYPGGATKAKVEKSLLSLHAAELSADSDTASLVYRVKEAYLTVLTSQRALAVKRDILATQESSLAQMEESFKLQQATVVDVQTARINVKSAQIDLASEQDTLGAARVSLVSLMGGGSDDEFSVEEVDASAESTLTLAEAIARGLAQRPELKQLALDLQSADIDLALILGQKTPSVSMSGGAYMMFGASAPTSAAAVSASLSLSMPVLDAGSALHREEENRHQREVYVREQSQKKRAISLEIEKAYNTLKRQRENLELARLRAENAEAYYQVEKTGNQYGTVTNHDVLAASVDAASAQVSWAEARSNVVLAALALQNAMGY